MLPSMTGKKWDLMITGADKAPEASGPDADAPVDHQHGLDAAAMEMLHHAKQDNFRGFSDSLSNFMELHKARAEAESDQD